MRHLAWALVMAAGKAEKLAPGAETSFLYLDDRPVLAYSIAALMQCPDIDGIVLSVPRERAESVLALVQLCGYSKVRKIVAAAPRRSASMAAALAHVPADVECLCVHDPSWPFPSPDTVSATIRSARRNGSGVAAVPIPDRVVSAPKGVFSAECPGQLWAVISPQTWPVAELRKAYPQTAKNRTNYDSDWAAMLAQGITPRLVPAAPSFRIRSADDLAPALDALRKSSPA